MYYPERKEVQDMFKYIILWALITALTPLTFVTGVIIGIFHYLLFAKEK